jgi:SAM-dependent methyltransferase
VTTSDGGWDERHPDNRRLGWDERHSHGDFEGDGPNPTLVGGVAGLTPSSALELAAGSGTNAVWLATQGWRTTAVDWSPVGLANGRAKKETAGVEVEWLERDLFVWTPPVGAFDLVVVVYLHLPPDERAVVYARAAAAVAPGGRLVVVAHDPINATEGQGGPPDTTRLFTAAELATELLAADPTLVVERAEVVRRVPLPDRAPIDALLLIRRP